jgi:hypothetical protein
MLSENRVTSVKEMSLWERVGKPMFDDLVEKKRLVDTELAQATALLQ